PAPLQELKSDYSYQVSYRDYADDDDDDDGFYDYYGNARASESEVQVLALQVIEGKFGNGEMRKAVLGDLYAVVQNKINELLGSPVRYVQPKNVMGPTMYSNGFYAASMQSQVDAQTIDALAKRVIKGEFGSGKMRKALLGDLYELVQARVNEMIHGMVIQALDRSQI
ncbi:MAG: hypothetical protein Q4E22_06675, partial [Coriobacteriia bacterium]|nr:hypothetical protein [Coriobacteriia bacterium]